PKSNIIVRYVEFMDIFPVLNDGRKVANVLLEALYWKQYSIPDIVLIPCNSIHIAYNYLTQAFGDRFIHINQAVITTIDQERRQGLFLILGTSTTINAGFYQEGLRQLGYGAISLPPEDQTWLDNFIFDELVRGTMNFGHLQTLRELEARYLRLLGVDHVILACTELCYLTRVFSKPEPYEVDSLQALHDAGLERLQYLFENRSNHAN
ncbi:MAG: aspartate/glutamate racemase family protein, partial [Deltaproteobacteria bacterium]